MTIKSNAGYLKTGFLAMALFKAFIKSKASLFHTDSHFTRNENFEKKLTLKVMGTLYNIFRLAIRNSSNKSVIRIQSLRLGSPSKSLYSPF